MLPVSIETVLLEAKDKDKQEEKVVTGCLVEMSDTGKSWYDCSLK